MIKKTSTKIPDIEYFIKGEDPKLLIHSGTHGDEYEIIAVVSRAVKKYEHLLPDFLYVPVVSPSAVKLRRRLNGNGKDLNRSFFIDSKESEVSENVEIIDNYSFDLAVSFHEDLQLNEYYVYDEGQNELITKKVLGHLDFLQKNGIVLLNGFDDQSDPHLGNEFNNGYFKYNYSPASELSGNFTSWLHINKGVEGILVPEIPGKAEIKKKEFIVDSFFRQVLL